MGHTPRGAAGETLRQAKASAWNGARLAPRRSVQQGDATAPSWPIRGPLPWPGGGARQTRRLCGVQWGQVESQKRFTGRPAFRPWP
jgi:hypothetical protein